MQSAKPRLAGKIALVTGAGSSGPGVGTGKATAILFAREGAQILLVDRDTQHVEETLASIQAEGGKAAVFIGDITQANDCAAMVTAAVEHFGGLHILINNVGIAAFGDVVNVKEADWDRVMAVNLKGMMLTSKYAIPAMIQCGGGSIINLASIEAMRVSGLGALIAYQASKGGVVSLTTGMAVHHGRDNIRVNCIAPGQLYTPMVAPYLSEEGRNLRCRANPLGTEGTAWDVAWAAVFLASEEARWITGVVLPVDGGLLTTAPPAMLPYLRA